MPVARWICPACTLFRGQICVLNSAPFRPDQEEKDNQGTDHLGGKKHQRAMKHVGQTLLSPESVTEFFTYVAGPEPDLTRISPVKALKDYIEECGGDPELTIVHFAPPPPPLAPEVGRRSTIKCVTR